MAATVELAVRLVRQAIEQDKKTNYEEAARCYREAIVNFRSASRTCSSKAIKKGIQEKCSQYEARLRLLEKFLLDTADLSPLFKECMPTDKMEVVDLLTKGLESVEKGKRKDQKGHLQEALECYVGGLDTIMELNRVGDDSVESEHLKFKCLLVHERIENIRNHLESGRPITAIKNSLDYNNGSQAGSPEPFYHAEEDEAKLMETASVLTSSHHSLYPRCEIAIPLAKINSELQLSTSSIASLSISPTEDEGSFEAVMNVTEIDFANSCLEGRSSGSDSGIDNTPAKEANNNDICKAELDVTDDVIEDDNASVILLVHRSVDGTPASTSSQSPTSSPSPKSAPTTIVRSRPSPRPEIEDEVTVLSREDVVDASIPPRALAGVVADDDDGEDINKGCFYFLACLDSLWVL